MIPVVVSNDGSQFTDWDGLTHLGDELFAGVVKDAHKALASILE